MLKFVDKQAEEAYKANCLGKSLSDLIKDQGAWSQATFGTDSERGPIGALKHLGKETIEAQLAWTMVEICEFKEEMADCLILLLDASRRGGISFQELVDEAAKKMTINKERQWPKPTSDEPVEHIHE
jgi:NTP pyrophosphatase (non-canonical NTP hydrolase)